VRIWRVRYGSTTASGRATTVSGVVLAPSVTGPASKVIGIGHGTTGLADQCAPSQTPTTSPAMPGLLAMAAAGYVVAATDYQGLGTPGLHSYLDGHAEGKAVLDAVRAARRLTGAGRDVALVGFSQGGHAVLWADALAPTYAGDLHVVGVAALSPLVDVDTFVRATASATQPRGDWGVTVLAAAAWRAAHPGLADGVLTAAGRVLAGRAEGTCWSALPGKGSRTTALRPGGVPSAAWERSLRADSLARVLRASSAPVLVVHALDDVTVPYAVTAPAVQALCAQGARITVRPLATGGHSGTVAGGMLARTGAWLAERFAGAPVAAGCHWEG
jgi:pimeloyl-ACP methyl ester carboxylesterase